MDYKGYQTPLSYRYGSKEMRYLFSEENRIKTWRKLWYVLAESEYEMGLAITKEQLAALKKAQETIDFDQAREYESRFDHEVMAHLHAYGDAAGSGAKDILHWGVTSAYVLDNTDLIQAKEALLLLKQKLTKLMQQLAHFAGQYKALPTLAYTHLQAAQLTTVGKRACLWLESFRLDYDFLNYQLEHLALRGIKGTTGSADSFKTLLNHNYAAYIELETKVVNKLGFSQAVPVTGQTYDRKIDSLLLQLLSQIAQSAHKFTSDLRLLQHEKELEEPFTAEQIGSSAMPYKRNPIKSEKVASLAKFVMALSEANSSVAATQWLERTLDDSANKRLSQPQAFIATDEILETLLYLTDDIVVYPQMIARHVAEELPFMATEPILMKLVARGKSRQEAHEKLRILAMQAGKRVKEAGLGNNLVKLIKNDTYFAGIEADLDNLTNSKQFIGFSKQQVEAYLLALREKLNVK